VTQWLLQFIRRTSQSDRCLSCDFVIFQMEPPGRQLYVYCVEWIHYTVCSLVLNLVPGIVSGTKRDCTCTARTVVQWHNCRYSEVTYTFYPSSLSHVCVKDFMMTWQDGGSNSDTTVDLVFPLKTQKKKSSSLRGFNLIEIFLFVFQSDLNTDTLYLPPPLSLPLLGFVH